ncbi:MAG TPA: hypothetical protein VMU77_04540 [Acidimicrobiales bacterium]|nr:hypothetical protein [Acidimicrobiales bacterium]
MPTAIVKIAVIAQCMFARCAYAMESEEGTVAETVVIVATFVALAIAAGAIIASKVTSAASSIQMN